mmetsp:Transcript_11801/g.24944  ORF Transcript_11801/g.24944 Transcript_11801/m.24944 type:complete len:265 (-) Transcript_11801:2964-3758(-)
MLTRFLFLLVGAQSVGAFLSQNQRSAPITAGLPSSSALSAAMSFDDLVTRVDHYEVRVPKPLGVVFGENPDPYLGLVVDDVSEGMNGGRAGLRIGDQLLAVNEQVVVGKDFDSVMGSLQAEPGSLNLIMYRGPVRQLFTVLSNQLDDDQSIVEDEDEYDENDIDSQPVVMDENYESPVRIEVKEEKPLTAGDFVKAFGKLGSMLGETLTSDPNEGVSDAAAVSSDAPAPPKKKTGFFGFGAEAIQLDAEDARGYRKEKIEPDEF